MDLRFKIFFGTYGFQADIQLNNWLDEHPEFEVVDYHMFHEQNEVHRHAIFIIYQLKKKCNHELIG